MNELAKVKEKELTWNESQIELIRRTVAKNSTDDEFSMFMYLAKTYQLDPIQKEIWFIKYNNNSTPIIMTSRDGYLTIANRNLHYEGLLSDVVHENDEFEKIPDGTVRHKYGCKNRGKIIGAYAIGYRNDRKFPVYIFAHFDEYFKKTSNIWVQYGSAMILKVAEAMMLKRLFSISGLVTKEEILIEDKEFEMPIPALEVKAEIVKDDFEEHNLKVVDKKRLEKVKVVKETEVVAEEELPTQADIDRIFPPSVTLATDKQKDMLIKMKSSKFIKQSELDKMPKLEKTNIDEASKMIKWWFGNKEDGIVGERELRELKDKDKPKGKRDELIELIRDTAKIKQIPKDKLKKISGMKTFDTLMGCKIEVLEKVLEYCQKY